MTGFLQNLRVSARGLARSRGFTVVAVVTLALGIGLATAVFTVADALLLRRLPVRDQGALIALWAAKRDGSFDDFPFTLDQAREFARRTRSLAQVAFYDRHGAYPVPVRDEGNVTRLRRSFVSGDFFDVLGSPPRIGRALRPEDDVVGAAPVVVLSHRGWLQRFGGDTAVLGRTIVMHQNGVSYAIVGVMPEGLDFPRGVDVWAPVVPGTTSSDTSRSGAELSLLGRLNRGALPPTAEAEVTDFFAGIAPQSPWYRDLRGIVHPFTNLVLGDAKPALLAFAAAAGLLLLITCTNVATLLLVRGLGRVREVAVRSALGARRSTIIGQLLAESALLAAAGGVIGIALAMLAVRAFVALAPPGAPRIDEISMSGAVLGAAVGITAVAMLLFALAPAMFTSSVETSQALRSGSRQVGTSRAFRLVTEALVVGQIALALLVLSSSALIARSLVRLERVDLSMDPSRLVIAELAVRYDQYGDRASQIAVLDRLVPRIEGVPGVRSVSPVVNVPFSGVSGIDGRVARDGQSDDDAVKNPIVGMEVAGTRYFETLGIPVLAGRAFTDADVAGAPMVVVVSQEMAGRYWPDENPLGKRLRIGREGALAEVVGVVPDTRYRDLRDSRPTIYFALRQSFFPFAPMTLAIRTATPPEDLIPAIRGAVNEVDPGVVLANAASFDAHRERPLAQPRLNAWLLATFAIAAVALATVGLFAVTATMVRQRTRELGVRLALGASTGNVQAMVLRRALVLAATGTGIGLLTALATNRVLATLLYAISPTDAPTLAVAAACLIVVALAASLAPARSSTKIDPVIALRAEG
jgi:putative ABC transport system permease protein